MAGGDRNIMNSSQPQTADKTVILVNGIPASGKSSVARRLSEHFSLPYLTIDGIKEPFMARLDNIDRQFNRTLGLAAYEVIWSIVEQAPHQCTYVIDAWFGFQPKAVLRQHLRNAGVTQVLEVWNQIPGDLAAERYASRLNNRTKGHPGAEYLPELRTLAGRATPMAIGPVLTIDQSKTIDFNEVIYWLLAHYVVSHVQSLVTVLKGLTADEA